MLNPRQMNRLFDNGFCARLQPLPLPRCHDDPTGRYLKPRRYDTTLTFPTRQRIHHDLCGFMPKQFWTGGQDCSVTPLRFGDAAIQTTLLQGVLERRACWKATIPWPFPRRQAQRQWSVGSRAGRGAGVPNALEFHSSAGWSAKIYRAGQGFLSRQNAIRRTWSSRVIQLILPLSRPMGRLHPYGRQVRSGRRRTGSTPCPCAGRWSECRRRSADRPPLPGRDRFPPENPVSRRPPDRIAPVAVISMAEAETTTFGAAMRQCRTQQGGSVWLKIRCFRSAVQRPVAMFPRPWTTASKCSSWRGSKVSTSGSQ